MCNEFSRLADKYAARLEPDNKAAREQIALDSLGFLNEVLGEYCLISKSRIKTELKVCLAAVESEDTDERLWGQFRLGSLKSLFPDIAKEVEDEKV